MSKVTKSSCAGQDILTYVLPCGVKCYIIPKKAFQEKQAMLCVNYGSMDTEFSINGIKYATPDGIAHFLEHKMFDDQHINVFDEFTKLKANLNAFTNYNMTAYHFSCRENFYESLKLLIDFVYTPYFTDENIEKEKDIIIQEIKMYRDVPSWRIFFNMQSMLYQKIPLYKDIAGTEASVLEIGKDMLYLCYNSFYRPDNMALICVGDVDADEVNRIAEDMMCKREGSCAVKIYGTEHDSVSSDYIEDKMEVSSSIFNIGFKDSENESNKLFLMNTTRILLDLLYGESSDFYWEMYKNGLIDNSFSFQYVSSQSYGTSIISGASPQPEKLRERLLDYCNLNFNKSKEMQARFEQMKRKALGLFIRNFNSIDNLANIQADFYLKDINLVDVINNLEALTIEDIQSRAERHFRKDNNVLSVIKPM